MDRDKQVMLYHTALILSKKLSAGSESANRKLTEMLSDFGTTQDAYLGLGGKLESISGIGKIYREIEKTEFFALTPEHPNYPKSLKDVVDAPPIMYAQGDLSVLLKPCIAVVGSRDIYDPNFEEEARRYVPQLVKKDYCIVSGLALGSDALAHRLAFGNKDAKGNHGSTIAVLGNPLNISYPKENSGLQDHIRKEGLILTQYPIGIARFGSYLAHRNQTIVGLSQGIVVVCAKDGSGTCHSIDFCAKQGKKIYALPANLKENQKWLWRYKTSMDDIETLVR